MNPSMAPSRGAPQQGKQAGQQPAPKLPPFEVVGITPVETGTLLCFADIKIGRGPNEVTVCKWRLIQQPGQAAWLSAPQESWLDEEGRRRYKNLFTYPRHWRGALSAAVLAAWQEELRKQREGRTV